MFVSVRSRNRILGTVTLLFAESEDHHGPKEFALVSTALRQDLAFRHATKALTCHFRVFDSVRAAQLTGGK